MQLKNYQTESLETLARFCDLVRSGVAVGVPLFGRQRFVFGKIRLDKRKKGGDLGLPRRSTHITGGDAMLGNFLDGTKVQTKTLARGALGDLFDEKGVADGTPKLHIVKHRVTNRKGRGNKFRNRT